MTTSSDELALVDGFLFHLVLALYAFAIGLVAYAGKGGHKPTKKDHRQRRHSA